MQASERQQHRYEFGAFEINAYTGELRKRGIKIKLADQPSQILLLLLERPGELVTREQIQNRLWPENTFVDFDNAINSSVRKLRDALGDSPDNPRFVETLARRGYRFIAPVSYAPRMIPEEVSSHRPTRLVEMPVVPSHATSRKRRALWIASSSAALLAALTVMLFWRGSQTDHRLGETSEPAVPLTGNRGYEGFPAFSPDGTRVTYAWTRPGEKVSNLYVKLVGQGEAVQLTRNSSSDFAPAWSPDGLWIAFLHVLQSSRAAIMIIPALGGQEREIAQVSLGSEELTRYWEGKSVSSPFLAWSADGRWLFSLQQNVQHGPFSIVRVSVDTGSERVLTFPPKDESGDGGVSVSPDGKTLAFTRTFGLFEKDIFVAPLSGDMLLKGEPRRLTVDNQEIDGLAWSADGHSLVFSSRRGGRRDLWQMPVARTGEPARITAAGDDPRDVAVARQGDYLVYSHAAPDWHIWRMRLDSHTPEQPQSLISSTRMEHLPKYSPDGTRIAFQSGRSGSQNIWLCEPDGTHPVQLTEVRNAWAGSPRWSPDGQKIAFDGNVSGSWDIYVIDAQGGKPVQLTNAKTQEFRPSWSHDGNWIYFCSTRTGRPEVWKVPAAGGATVPVTRNGGGVAFESVDGVDLYYTKEGQLWKMPVRGGNETLVVPSMLLDNNYALAKNGIYFLQGTSSDATVRLQFLNFATKSIRNIGAIPGTSGDEIAVSPDERWLLYANTSGAGSEIMLIKNFR